MAQAIPASGYGDQQHAGWQRAVRQLAASDEPVASSWGCRRCSDTGHLGPVVRHGGDDAEYTQSSSKTHNMQYYVILSCHVLSCLVLSRNVSYRVVLYLKGDAFRSFCHVRKLCGRAARTTKIKDCEMSASAYRFCGVIRYFPHGVDFQVWRSSSFSPGQRLDYWITYFAAF